MCLKDIIICKFSKWTHLFDSRVRPELIEFTLEEAAMNQIMPIVNVLRA